MKTIGWACSLVVMALVAGCGDDSGGSGGGGGESSTTTGSGTGSGSDCIEVNDAVGGEACSVETCEPGEYCNVNICDLGCRSSSTCANGEYCDLSTADEIKAGTCRTPGANDTICGQSTSNTSSGTSGGSCQDDCYAKLIECGFDLDVGIDPVAGCTDLCATTSEEDLACLVAAPCADFEDGVACGVVLPQPESTTSGG